MYKIRHTYASYAKYARISKMKKKKKKTRTKNKKEISNRYIREHQQKTCLMLSRFMAVKGGETFRGNPLKKENL